MPSRNPCLVDVAPELRESGELEFYQEWMIAAVRNDEIQLPLLPQAARDVLLVANDPQSDIADLASIIERDQSLASNVLRVSNSAAFGGAQFNSLQQAIALLGMRNLVELTVSIALRNGIFNVPGYHDELTTIWSHALASAAYGKIIAQTRGTDPEVQYLCGLLHTVGKPITLHMLVSMQREKIWPVQRREILYLVEVLHPTLGSELARQWNLSPKLATVCEWYGVYQDAPEFIGEAAMTYLSHVLASQLVQNKEALPIQELTQDPIFEFLSLSPDQVQSILAKSGTITSLVRSI